VCSDRAPTPPSALVADYPEALEAVVMKALAKSPDQRFANGAEMLSALEDAMPEPLEARFDRQVAEYLKGLFGAQASERRAAIRLAQVQADRQRADASMSSVGTLRAISIERQDSGSFAVNPSAVPIEASQPGQVQASVSEGRSRWQLAAIGVALSFSVLGLAFELGHGSTPAASTAAASRGPPETLLPVAPIARATPPVAPAVAPGVPSSAPESRPELADKHERKATRAAHAPALPQKTQATPPSPASEPAVVAAPSSAAPAAAVASSNAWNRGAFGGRH
jgi:hypothetical protein